ncbi:Required for meiotic nuclear division protein 1 [Trichoderma lentiforme]|uniref:Required for meiotic nuclear division protein 1 n=1 Tax=Trichoderma lentiforme TaxID=1567552 RepID=A0A9P4XCB2_9HYPO|nr:Required for meiotic nuclear division protein 1 [Trichoderma lentiforme]
MRTSPLRISVNVAARQIHSLVPAPRPRRSFHLTTPASLPRKRNFFTSNPYLSSQPGSDDAKPYPYQGQGHDQDKPGPANASPVAKRKPTRATPTKNSLRRVAIIAQQPKRGSQGSPGIDAAEADPSNMVSATCIAEAFNMPMVLEILSSHGFAIDPDGTRFDAAEVVHARGVNGGDIFVFPLGTIVTWSLPPDVVTKQILRAAEEPHAESLREVEDLEFTTDNGRETSSLKGDVVVLGTRKEHKDGDFLDTTLAKIAFSSGLARSTKLAVLESALTSYFESTRNIPALLSQGTGVPLSRKFILQKTGELLSLRAKLNHYSELTDNLPDIFWDSKSELGLEGYYDQVGRALDVNVRIRALNQKMDYAQEIATVLREMSSEQHGTRLEWIIIVLIAVEVVFELRRIVIEYNEKALARELGTEI